MSFTVLATRSSAAGLEIDVHVPTDCPFLRGHFPRHPILPAVALLDLVARLGAAHTELDPSPSSLKGLRLRGSVFPDTRIQIQLTPASDSLAFRVSSGNSIATQGRFGYALDSSPADLTSAQQASFGQLQPLTKPQPAPALPHTGPALLIDRVLARDENGVLCLARIPADSPFRGTTSSFDNALVPSLLAIELAAQASAAHGQDDPGGGSAAADAGRGFIVNVRQAWFADATLDADQEFLVEARQTSLAAPLRNYAAQVRTAAGQLLGAAQLGTWVPSVE